MPTLEELKGQMAQEGVRDQGERNQRIAQGVAAGTLGGPRPQHEEPELSDVEAGQTWEGYQPELIDEEVAQRMTPTPEEEFTGIVGRMAQNYQTSPQYAQMLDQELAQISAQIADLTQRRNVIEMALRGQG